MGVPSAMPHGRHGSPPKWASRTGSRGMLSRRNTFSTPVAELHTELGDRFALAVIASNSGHLAFDAGDVDAGDRAVRGSAAALRLRSGIQRVLSRRSNGSRSRLRPEETLFLHSGSSGRRRQHGRRCIFLRGSRVMNNVLPRASIRRRERREPARRRHWPKGEHSAWNERETRPWNSQGLTAGPTNVDP